ncbi:MAG: metalloregulator ArsR/SmtB family transcription factor [Sporolactobacillus sp.]|jgi:DNA-binding transcriptional ArsR family regulator|nr:metalloregulator ArsR/SmtB family transcription factor [Sporolactobacillus sp.]MCI1882781.1 metalloregulator ArsR/SmtB family transcription factor [Sporolactobacillus sp.]
MPDKQTTELDQRTLTAVSQIFKAVADPTRIRILYLLSQGECSVSEIARRLHLHQSAVSHQLGFLRHLNLVKSRRSGKEVFYSEEDEHVMTILSQTIIHARHGSTDQ